MIEGIDYYPGKSQKKSKIKFRFFILLILLLGIYIGVQYYPQNVQKSNNPTLIVISKGEKKQNNKIHSVIIKSNESYQPTVQDNRVKSHKGLDEVIQIYQKK